MKNLKFSTLITLFLVVGMSMFTSCGKDSTDVSDKDEVGKFEITIDGKKETGTKVFNAAAMGVRTISAENKNIILSLLFNESDFKSGRTIDFSEEDNDELLSTLKRQDKVAIIKRGTVKIVSKSKIEFKNCVFSEMSANGEMKDIAVSGYISSK